MNSRIEVLARVRGAAVGSLSGAVSIAAHGIAGGGMPPTERSLDWVNRSNPERSRHK